MLPHVLSWMFLAPPATVDADVDATSEATTETTSAPAPQAAPPGSPAETPRLFETLQRLRQDEVAFYTNDEETVTFIPGIQVRNQVGWVSPFTIDRFGDRYEEREFTSGRVRLNPTLRLGKRQNFEVVLNVDFANGRWAPPRASSPTNLSATAPSVANASVPTVSAVQNDEQPASRAVRAMASPTSRPRAWKLAKVSPTGRSGAMLAASVDMARNGSRGHQRGDPEVWFGKRRPRRPRRGVPFWPEANESA